MRQANTSQPVYQVFVAGICALLLSAGLARFAYTPLLPVMREQAGLSYLAGGWLATFNYMGYMTGVVITSFVTRLRIKYDLYRLGLVTAVVSTAAMGLTDNVVVWAILRFIAGISTTGGVLLASGLIMNWLIRAQHRPLLGLHFSGLGLGIALSGLAVGWMLHAHLAWHTQWLILGALGVLCLIPAWLWMPLPADVPTKAGQVSLPPPSRLWMNVLIAAYFCAGVGFVISATFIVAIVEKIPLLAGKGSWVWVMVGLAAAPSAFLWDKAAHVVGQIPALIAAYVLQTVSIVLPAVSSATLPNLLSALLYGNTFVGIVSLTLSLIGQRFPNNPAKAMARLTLSYGVGQMVAPAVAGYIASRTGSYHGALGLTAWVMVVGTGFLLLLSRINQRDAAR